MTPDCLRTGTTVAPGRTYDMQMLVNTRDQAAVGSKQWLTCQRKIDDLVEEGRCKVIYSLRAQLLKASIAQDNDVILHISEQITEHMKRKHLRRFSRAWMTKG